MRFYIILVLILINSTQLLSQQLNFPKKIFSQHMELFYKDKTSFKLKGKVKSVSAYETKLSNVKWTKRKRIKYYQLDFDTSGKLIGKHVYNFDRENSLNYKLLITQSKDAIVCDFRNADDVIYKKITSTYDTNKKLIETESVLTFKNTPYDKDVKTTLKYNGDDLIETKVYKRKDSTYTLETETLITHTDSVNYSSKEYRIITYGNIKNKYGKIFESKANEFTIKDSLDRVISHKGQYGLRPTLYEYDKNGNIKKETINYSDLVYVYDDKQRLIEKHFGTHHMKPKQFYEYNDKNERINTKQLANNGTVDFEQRIKYDEYGNWKEFIFYQKGILIGITTFEITYYE